VPSHSTREHNGPAGHSLLLGILCKKQSGPWEIDFTDHGVILGAFEMQGDMGGFSGMGGGGGEPVD
jgi:hypothetical protein